MKFLNCTNNTIYLDDINLYLPFTDQPQYLDTESIKKSKSFQFLVRIAKIKIVEIDDSRIEKNLKRLQDSFSLEKQEEMPNDPEPDNANMNICIKGHFEDAGGYAKVNRNLALGLQSVGANVFIETMGSTNDLNEIEVQQLAPFKKPSPRKCIHIDSIIPSFSNISTGLYNILYTTIESYTVPKQFLDTLNSYNEIWVVSDFCKKVLGKYDITKDIFVLPDTLNLKLYTEKGDKYRFRPELNDFVFLSVFGWSYRKGYDVLLKAYLREFSGDDPVTLLIMSRLNNNRKQDKVIEDEVDKFIKKYGEDNPPHIARCSQVVPEYLMPNIYRACDAYVLFSRAEAFSLTVAEASLCGLPVISTNCSGQTMFLNHDNSYLLDIDELKPLDPGLIHIHFWANEVMPTFTSDWAIEEASKLMRTVFENTDRARKKNKKLQTFIKKNFEIGKVAKKAYNRLENIWSTL